MVNQSHIILNDFQNESWLRKQTSWFLFTYLPLYECSLPYHWMRKASQVGLGSTYIWLCLYDCVVCIYLFLWPRCSRMWLLYVIWFILVMFSGNAEISWCKTLIIHSSIEIPVRYPDTDVFVLLVDLGSRNHLGDQTQLIFSHREDGCFLSCTVDVRQCASMRKAFRGIKMSQRQIGTVVTSFFEVTNRPWITSYLAFNSYDPVKNSFQNLQNAPFTETGLVDEDIPEQGVYKILPQLRLEFFSCKKLLDEMLPHNGLLYVLSIQHNRTVIGLYGISYNRIIIA